MTERPSPATPISGVALVGKGDFHALAGGLLHPLAELGYLSSLLFVGGDHHDGEQVSQKFVTQKSPIS